MSTLAGDFWVCAECRSINNAGAKQCYNCRTPRDLAAVDPMTIEGTGHGKLREVALPPFHSPRPYAAIASILILATAGLQVVLTVGTTTLLLQVLDGTKAEPNQLSYIGIVGLIALTVGAAALVGWSLWLSRAVTSMPALGLGYPAASGLMAFVENFLPGLNLLRVPAIVRDVVRRLEPGSTAGQSRGEALIFAAWVGLLGGFVVPRVGAFLSGFSSDSPDDVIRTNLTIAGIGMGLVLVGALFLVALIWWIEERIDRRREAQLAEIDAQVAGATGDPSEGVDEPAPVPAPASPAMPAMAAVARPAERDAAAWSWAGSAASPLAAQAPSPQPGASEGQQPAVPLAPGWERAPVPSSEPGVDGDVQRHAWADRQPGDLATPAVDSPAAAAQPEAPADLQIGATEAMPPPEPEPQPEPIAQVAPPTFEPAPEPEAAPEPEPQPVAAPAPEFVPPAESTSTNGGPPHLTIRVSRMGMLQAEMAGETEPIILEDLAAYGTALAHAGGSAEILLAPGDDMARLIGKRAQRILADSGIDVQIPD